MKTKYNEIFKSIVNAYYTDNFDNLINELLLDPSIDKHTLTSLISSLCGVDVEFTNSAEYVPALKKAILAYESNHKIVTKLNNCSMKCADENGETACQKSCPFNAILFDKDKNTTFIDPNLCTDCGKCIDACSNDLLLDKVEFIPLANLLKGNTPVVAAVAPAISGQFGENVSLDQMRTAFKKMGFTDMIEVAFFADMLTLKEAIEFDEHVKNKNDLMITSCCCPMWVGMLKKSYKDLVKHVSPSVSPMIAAGRVLKKLNPNVKVVFIGPCIAKKAEAKDKDLVGDIDFVLTFAEIKDIFEILNINPENLIGEPSTDYASREGRLYARTGGVSIAVNEAVTKLYPEKAKLFKAVQANGVKECKAILEKAKNGDIDANFIEGMGCVGGCVGGPKALIPKEDGTRSVNEFADNSNIKIALDSSCMKEMLGKLGINSEEDYKDRTKIDIFEREF